MITPAVFIALCAAPQPQVQTSTEAIDASIDIEELKFELSLPTKDDEEAWEDTGFRLMLGYVHGRLYGLEAAQNFVSNGVELRLGVRLSKRWSLHGAFRYSLMTVSGVVATGAIEPTLHLIKGLSVSLGLGMTVFVMNRRLSLVERGDLIASRTFPSDRQVISGCTGFGLLAQARVQYLFVLGSIWSSGPVVRAGLSRTACEQSISRNNNDTADSIAIRQFWSHLSWSVGWLLAWR